MPLRRKMSRNRSSMRPSTNTTALTDDSRVEDSSRMENTLWWKKFENTRISRSLSLYAERPSDVLDSRSSAFSTEMYNSWQNYVPEDERQSINFPIVPVAGPKSVDGVGDVEENRGNSSSDSLPLQPPKKRQVLRLKKSMKRKSSGRSKFDEIWDNSDFQKDRISSHTRSKDHTESFIDADESSDTMILPKSRKPAFLQKLKRNEDKARISLKLSSSSSESEEEEFNSQSKLKEQDKVSHAFNKSRSDIIHPSHEIEEEASSRSKSIYQGDVNVSHASNKSRSTTTRLAHEEKEKRNSQSKLTNWSVGNSLTLGEKTLQHETRSRSKSTSNAKNEEELLERQHVSVLREQRSSYVVNKSLMKKKQDVSGTVHGLEGNENVTVGSPSQVSMRSTRHSTIANVTASTDVNSTEKQKQKEFRRQSETVLEYVSQDSTAAFEEGENNDNLQRSLSKIPDHLQPTYSSPGSDNSDSKGSTKKSAGNNFRKTRKENPSVSNVSSHNSKAGHLSTGKKSLSLSNISKKSQTKLNKSGTNLKNAQTRKSSFLEEFLDSDDSEPDSDTGETSKNASGRGPNVAGQKITTNISLDSINNSKQPQSKFSQRRTSANISKRPRSSFLADADADESETNVANKSRASSHAAEEGLKNVAGHNSRVGDQSTQEKSSTSLSASKKSQFNKSENVSQMRGLLEMSSTSSSSDSDEPQNLQSRSLGSYHSKNLPGDHSAGSSRCSDDGDEIMNSDSDQDTSQNVEISNKRSHSSKRKSSGTRNETRIEGNRNSQEKQKFTTDLAKDLRLSPRAARDSNPSKSSVDKQRFSYTPLSPLALEQRRQLLLKMAKEPMERAKKMKEDAEARRKLREKLVRQEENRKKKLEREAKMPDVYKVNGKVYKPPRLPRPKSWCTNRMYKLFMDKMKPKYEMRNRIKAEQLMVNFAEAVTYIEKTKSYKDYRDVRVAVMKKFAKEGIIETPWEFYVFCFEYMPKAFQFKVCPMLMPGNIINCPVTKKHCIHKPILKHNDEDL